MGFEDGQRYLRWKEGLGHEKETGPDVRSPLFGAPPGGLGYVSPLPLIQDDVLPEYFSRRQVHYEFGETKK